MTIGQNIDLLAVGVNRKATGIYVGYAIDHFDLTVQVDVFAADAVVIVGVEVDLRQRAVQFQCEGRQEVRSC